MADYDCPLAGNPNCRQKTDHVQRADGFSSVRRQLAGVLRLKRRKSKASTKAAMTLWSFRDLPGMYSLSPTIAGDGGSSPANYRRLNVQSLMPSPA